MPDPTPPENPLPRPDAEGRSGLPRFYPHPGDVVNGFELEEEIGQGGMGFVYRARQLSLDREVAIKLMHQHLFDDRVAKARFLTEARAIAKLEHPNIVPIYQVGECDFGPYFAMAYVPGKTLMEILELGQQKISAAVSTLTRITDAVAYAHSQQIIHRDLKPQNIMIKKGGKPLVMDFGLAKMLGNATQLTEVGTGLGTPSYMAPEQSGETTYSTGPRSDIYSLGAILYTALTGRPPFLEESAVGTILKVVSDEPAPPLWKRRPEVPEDLERICLRCLAKNPDERYSAATDLLVALRRFKADSKKPLSPRVELFLENTDRRILLKEPVTVIGRDHTCDIVLASPKVSKRHCRVLRRPELAVHDLGSSNGTYVNDEKTPRARLSDGDALRVSGHTLRVKILGE